jgi:hypothetical protein
MIEENFLKLAGSKKTNIILFILDEKILMKKMIE